MVPELPCFGACGSNRTFGSYYLADVKPAAGLFRILKISGGTTSIAAEEEVGFPLRRSDPFELILTGEVSGEAIRLTLTLHQQLDDHPRYRRRFADRVHRHFFHGGPLTVARNQERFQASASLIEEAVIGESARWGDFRRNPPYTRANWQGAVDRMLSNWFPSRSGTVLSQLRNRGLYPDTAAPVFNQHGGQVPEGFLLTLDAPEGEIYYTLDGSDPDGPGGILLGGASTTETMIAARSPGWRYLVTARPQSDSGVVVGHPEYDVSDWKHPAFDDQSWPTGQAPLGYGGVGNPGWATEISDGGTLPRNRTTYLRKSFSVSNADSYSALKVNIRRDDGAVVYLNGREIARSNMPDGVIAYADTALAGGFGSGESSYYEETVTLLPGALTEGSNTLAVEIHQESDSSSDLVIDVELLGVTSRDRAPRIVANTRVKARALHEGGWSALNEATFYVTSPASASNLAISEIHYHPAEPGDGLEYLELQNISDQESIHLDGLSFTAGITFTFPEGTTLAPGERLLVVENRTAFEAAYGPGLPVAGEYARRLSNGGETIALGEFLSVSYEDRLPWSELADGSGRSLVFTGGDPNDPARWRASAVEGGTPGVPTSSLLREMTSRATLLAALARGSARMADFPHPATSVPTICPTILRAVVTSPRGRSRRAGNLSERLFWTDLLS